jgi:hypothetical protein
VSLILRFASLDLKLQCGSFFLCFHSKRLAIFCRIIPIFGHPFYFFFAFLYILLWFSFLCIAELASLEFDLTWLLCSSFFLQVDTEDCCPGATLCGTFLLDLDPAIFWVSFRIWYRFTLKQEPLFTYTRLNVLRSAPEFGGLHSGCIHGLSKLVM